MDSVWIVYEESMKRVSTKYGKDMGKAWERYRKGMDKVGQKITRHLISGKKRNSLWKEKE